MIPLADESVQCCVTSPPYWGLRKYAGEQELVWGGRANCEHEWTDEPISVETTAAARWNHAKNGPELQHGRHQTRFRGSTREVQAERTFARLLLGACTSCGAWRGAYGLEPTVEMYVQHTVEILREIRRVLRSDGVCFWNIGDSYHNGGKGGYHRGRVVNDGSIQASNLASDFPLAPHRLPQPGLKPKDLCLIPQRVALAAQGDGWRVRSDIIWAKPNPMPESCKDRPTDAYEHILMLTKSARYYWDADAVAELAATPADSKARCGFGSLDGKCNTMKYSHSNKTGKRWEKTPTRNLRNVWTFPTQPYKGAHFATFPEELPKRCILAASRPGDAVLDPFAGSGTVGQVAIALRRKPILLDLAYRGQDYAPLVTRRTTEVQVEAFA